MYKDYSIETIKQIESILNEILNNLEDKVVRGRYSAFNSNKLFKLKQKEKAKDKRHDIPDTAIVDIVEIAGGVLLLVTPWKKNRRGINC